MDEETCFSVVPFSLTLMLFRSRIQPVKISIEIPWSMPVAPALAPHTLCIFLIIILIIYICTYFDNTATASDIVMISSLLLRVCNRARGARRG